MVAEDLTIRSINMSGQHMFGYFSKEAVGQNFNMLIAKHYTKMMPKDIPKGKG